MHLVAAPRSRYWTVVLLIWGHETWVHPGRSGANSGSSWPAARNCITPVRCLETGGQRRVGGPEHRRGPPSRQNQRNRPRQAGNSFRGGRVPPHHLSWCGATTLVLSRTVRPRSHPGRTTSRPDLLPPRHHHRSVQRHLPLEPRRRHPYRGGVTSRPSQDLAISVSPAPSRSRANATPPFPVRLTFPPGRTCEPCAAG